MSADPSSEEHEELGVTAALRRLRDAIDTIDRAEESLRMLLEFDSTLPLYLRRRLKNIADLHLRCLVRLGRR